MRGLSTHDIVPSQPGDVATARARITWLPPERVERMPDRDPTLAAALALCTGGGGHLYVGDRLPGLALIGVYIAAIAVLPGGAALVALVCVGALAALHARARAIRIAQYLAARRRADAAASGVHPTQVLLTAARAVQPSAWPPLPALATPPDAGAYGDLAARLRQIAMLRATGVMDAAEYTDRKLSLLESVAPTDTRALEDLLAVLVRLEHEGVLTRDDVTFAKELGAHG